MSGFKFKFGKVLAIKERLEGMYRHELSRLLTAEANEKRLLWQMEEARDNTWSTQREELRRAVPIERLRFYHDYARTLAAQVAVQRQAVAESARAVASGREKLLAVRQEMQILNKLREKQRKQYIMMENRREQKRLDEAIGSKRGRTAQSSDWGDE